ncbi:PulJ/GspJ family protein [Paractinoplanes atraurantiacus]|uniref:Prepilin-type N-terminal cleavage/methylation domain-containing protein n=1 Tax=Paractinoplanes atraurantiacus TaxID=1036182 RepID=A0A285K598_9ACTN|nr:type II secretion system protein [Actinoplanes atraurantiacus]SNY66511.1 prepilin-type N-terminal cleavage/methylation domain-containing protein [Actinoplanes atraurantiacus]
MSAPPEEKDGGYSLLELIVAMGIMSVVLVVVFGGIMQVYSAVNRTEGTSFARDQVAAAFRRLDTQLRYASWLSSKAAVPVGGRYYLEFALPTGCRQLVYDNGVLTLASWTAPAAPGKAMVVASELALMPGTAPFTVITPTEQPYASASAGSDAMGSGYTPEFYQIRLRLNATVGTTTIPFDTLFSAENTTRNTNTENPCSSGRPSS